MPSTQQLLCAFPTLRSTYTLFPGNSVLGNRIALNTMQTGMPKDGNFFNWKRADVNIIQPKIDQGWEGMDSVCVHVGGGEGLERGSLSSELCGNWLSFLHKLTWKQPVATVGEHHLSAKHWTLHDSMPRAQSTSGWPGNKWNSQSRARYSFRECMCPVTDWEPGNMEVKAVPAQRSPLFKERRQPSKLFQVVSCAGSLGH